MGSHKKSRTVRGCRCNCRYLIVVSCIIISTIMIIAITDSIIIILTKFGLYL